MVVADTNLWARAFLNDDASQSRKARKALAEARSKGGVFVPLIVLAELAWVLRGRWERDRVLSMLESLLLTRGVTVESPALAFNALKATRGGQGGFADHLIAEVGFANGAKQVLTFDDKFSKSPRIRRVR
ncbi:MAG TPA: type II toxin-antitoxin system VapC family toxin [Terracidiphilus sp.]|nr:type II toxin-antitoxin system VapC family toxin [Terracidiphilus sp.]